MNPHNLNRAEAVAAAQQLSEEALALLAHGARRRKRSGRGAPTVDATIAEVIRMRVVATAVSSLTELATRLLDTPNGPPIHNCRC